MLWSLLILWLLLASTPSSSLVGAVPTKKPDVSEVASRIAFGTFGSTEVDIDEGFLSGGVSVGLGNAQEIGSILGSGLGPVNLGSVVIGGGGNCGGGGHCFGGSWGDMFSKASSVSVSTVTTETVTTSFGLIEVDSVDGSGNTVSKPIQVENPLIPVTVPRDGTLVTKLLEKLTILTILQTNLGNVFRVLLATQVVTINLEIYNPILALYNAIILRQINIELLLPVIGRLYNSPPATQIITIIPEIIKFSPPEILPQVKNLLLIFQRQEIQVILGGSLKIPSICEGFSLEQVTYLLDVKIPAIGSGYTDISITTIQHVIEHVLRPILAQISINTKRLVVKNIVYLILVNLPLGYRIPEAPFRVRDFALKLLVILPDDVWDLLMPRIRLIPLDNIYEAVRLFLSLLLDTPKVPALIIAYAKVIMTFIPGDVPVYVPGTVQPTPSPDVEITWTLWPPIPQQIFPEIDAVPQPDIYIPDEIVVELPPPVELPPGDQQVIIGTKGFPSLTIISIILPPAPTEIDTPSILLPFCPLTITGCDKLEAIRLLLRRQEIIVRIRRELNPLDYPNRALLLEAILKLVVRLNLGPGEIIIKIKEYLSQLETEPVGKYFQPWFLKLFGSVITPANDREQKLMDIIVRWLTQQQVYNIIGAGFDPRPYQTVGQLLKYVLEFSVRNIIQVQQNPPLVEAIKYYITKIKVSTVATQSLEDTLTRYTVVRKAVNLNRILLTLDRDRIGRDLQTRVLEFFNYEFKPSVHTVGFNFTKYATKGEFLKGLVEHLVRQNISQGAKSVLQSIRPLIRVHGIGAQAIDFIK